MTARTLQLSVLAFVTDVPKAEVLFAPFLPSLFISASLRIFLTTASG